MSIQTASKVHQSSATKLGVNQNIRNEYEVICSANNHLQGSAFSKLRNVNCELVRGVLVLRGRVNSYYEKQMAQETVRHVKGIDKICNEINVDPGTQLSQMLWGNSGEWVGQEAAFVFDENGISRSLQVAATFGSEAR